MGTTSGQNDASSAESEQAAVGRASGPARVDRPLTSYRRRLPHWRLTGATYFVTWRVHEAQLDLDSNERTLVASALRHFDRERYELVAYAVMNDHVHVLVRPFDQHRLQDIVRSWKSYTAGCIVRQHRRRGPVWQDEYFDRIVRDERELLEKTQYILNNPRKRWPEIADYPWVWSIGL